MKFLVKVFGSLLFCAVASSEPIFNEFLMHIQLGLQEGLTTALTKVSEWTKTVEHSAALMGTTFLQELKDLLGQLMGTTAEKVTNATTSIYNSIDSGKEVGGDTYQEVGGQVLQAITSVRDKVSRSLREAQATYNKGTALVNDILEENSKKLEEVASEFRDEHKKAPRKYRDKIESLVEEFVKKCKEALSACCQEILVSMKEMLKNTLDSINEILPGVESAAAKLKKCMRENADSQQELIKCATHAKRSIPSAGDMDDFLASMQDDIFKFKDNVNHSCLGTAFDSIVREKDELDNKVQAILNNDKIKSLSGRTLPNSESGESESSETEDSSTESPETESTAGSSEMESLNCNYTFDGVTIVIPKIGDDECPQQTKVGNGVYILNN